jgi:hypothetical protein
MGDATMATSDMEKVLSVFKDIGDRDPDLAVKSLHPTKYTQHNPRAFDGVAGVKELIARLPCETSPSHDDPGLPGRVLRLHSYRGKRARSEYLF